LDAPLCDRLAHFYHRALLWSVDLSLATDTDCVVPGLFYGYKVNFVLKLAVDVIQKGVPFFLREFEPFGQIVVLEKVFIFEACAINGVTCKFLDREGLVLVLVLFLLLLLVIFLLIIFFIFLCLFFDLSPNLQPQNGNKPGLSRALNLLTQFKQ
jgi:hypothetical protein